MDAEAALKAPQGATASLVTFLVRIDPVDVDLIIMVWCGVESNGLCKFLTALKAFKETGFSTLSLFGFDLPCSFLTYIECRLPGVHLKQ